MWTDISLKEIFSPNLYPSPGESQGGREIPGTVSEENLILTDLVI